MKIVRGFHNLTKTTQGRVVTIGNFDGMHLGHQQLLHRVESLAEQKQLLSLIMIFEPQPEEYFRHKNIPARLMRLREKISFLCQFSIDEILVIPFNKSVAEKTAAQFVQEILIDRLQAKQLVVGEDFSFGENREGDVAYLQKTQNSTNFKIEVFKSIYYDLNDQKKRISSSWIRELLYQGDIQTAEKLLGHTFSLCGQVVQGDQRGRSLSFPTANVFLHRKQSPLTGVFVVKVEGVCENPIPGIANIGLRPTIGGTCPLLEVHLFGFSQNIYGLRVKVDFIKKLREERKFTSLILLKEQIADDIRQAKNFFLPASDSY